MIKKSIWIIILLPALVIAEQAVVLHPNITTEVPLSQDDLTRVFINDDAISEAWTISSNLDIKAEPNNGEMYLNLRDKNNLSKITLFIMTNKGARYTLLLNPSIQGGAVLELKPVSNDQEQTIATQSSDTYESTIVNLFKAVHIKGTAPGFTQVKTPGLKLANKHLKFKSIYELASSKWTITKIAIINAKQHSIYISPNYLKTAGIVAIGILTANLAAGESTFAYVIREKG